MNIRLIGIVIGPVLGLAGGVVGAYCSYRAARGPRERRFVIWASLALAVLILSFLAALLLVPQAKVWLWISYPLTLAMSIRYLNRKQNAIRRGEHADA
jgi:MFS family permease